MTLVEHLKSDSDVLKLVLIAFSLAVLCLSALLLVVWTCASRPKPRGKRKELQRPFRTKKRTAVSKSGYPTRTAFQRSWSPQGFPQLLPQHSLFRPFPSANESSSPINYFHSPNETSSPINNLSTPKESSSPVRDLKENQGTPNSGSHFLGQVLACINSSERKSSPHQRSRYSPVRPVLLRQSFPTRNVPFGLNRPIEEQSSSILECTSPSTIDISSNEDRESPRITADKAVNTESKDFEKETEKRDEPKEVLPKKETKKVKCVLRSAPKKQHFDIPLRLWAHKCPLPCYSELLERRVPYASVFSSDTSSSSSDHQHESEEKSTYSEEQDKFDLDEEYFYEEIDQNGRGTLRDKYSSYARGADASVQTDCHHFHNIKDLNNRQAKPTRRTLFNQSINNQKTSSTHKAGRKGKSHKPSKRTLSIGKQPQKDNTIDIDTEERLEAEAELLLLNRTSFIPPKNWYSLGSLCDDDDICQSCGKGNDFNHHHNHHVNSDDSDTKLNTSTMDAVSYNDTGYTSTEEEDSTTNSNSKEESFQSKHENGSYDGDYESDSDEVSRESVTEGDDMVIKPRPSIGDPISIQEYADTEWKGDTPKAQAVRKGYAVIPSHVSCHCVRQVRGDNYCAIRATLFQALLLNDVPILDRIPEGQITKIPEILVDSTSGAIEEWSFAGRLSVEKSEVLSTLQQFLAFLTEQVHKSKSLTITESRTDHLLSVFNDQSGDGEFRLLEAVKLIMFYVATQLYRDMNGGKNVPVCAWLLYARDSSPDPRRLLTQHLNCVGDSGGLEQVEMCLLGYALGVVIQVIRPSQVDEQDFIAYYPAIEDMPAYTPTVTLVAEDDRHYNIVV